ncbi:uncharacterized protein METZ01_LOCUS284673, partial [marine metagenome]
VSIGKIYRESRFVRDSVSTFEHPGTTYTRAHVLILSTLPPFCGPLYASLLLCLSA